MHEDWPRRVALEFDSRLAEEPSASPIRQLVLYKLAMRSAAQNLDWSPGSFPAAMELEDRLAMTMRFVRAVEGGHLGTVGHCLQRYPTLAELSTNPYALLNSGPAALQPYRDHAVQLARDHALDELGKLHDNLPIMTENQIQQHRQRNYRLLSRLAPGRGGHFAL